MHQNITSLATGVFLEGHIFSIFPRILFPNLVQFECGRSQCKENKRKQKANEAKKSCFYIITYLEDLPSNFNLV